MIAVIFTDGSCYVKTKVGGWAFVILNKNEEILFEANDNQIPNTTNNEMELSAIFNGLTGAKEMGFKEVILFTDSEYSQKSITEWCLKWINNPLAEPKNHKLIRYCHAKMNEFEKCEIVHIKGHSGNRWNEYVDKKCSYLGTAKEQKKEEIKGYIESF